MSEDLRRTALHERHVAAGARLVPFAGFEMPVQYSSIKEEHVAVREQAGLFDVSHMGQIHFDGPDAIALVDHLVSCDVATLGVGRARYGLMLAEDGGCIDDVMVSRTAEDSLFLCVNASNVTACWDWVRSRTHGDVRVENRSDETSLLALQGPAARPLLERLASEPSILPKRFRLATVSIDGRSVLVSATGYTGSPGYELYVANGDAPGLWNRLLETGHDLGVRPAGLGARDTLRLEAALPLYGHELDRETTPFEARLDRFVKPLERDFVGAEGLARRADEPDPRRLVGFEMVGRGIARADYPIVRDGRTIGRVTSGAPSPSLGKSIGLGYVPRSSSGVGEALEIEIRGKGVEARIVETPFR